MRSSVSLLLAEGHTNAGRYPLWMLSYETRIAQARINSLAVTNAILIQAAAASVLDKKGVKHFNQLIKRLTGNGNQ